MRGARWEQFTNCIRREIDFGGLSREAFSSHLINTPDAAQKFSNSLARRAIGPPPVRPPTHSARENVGRTWYHCLRWASATADRRQNEQQKREIYHLKGDPDLCSGEMLLQHQFEPPIVHLTMDAGLWSLVENLTFCLSCDKNNFIVFIFCIYNINICWKVNF